MKKIWEFMKTRLFITGVIIVLQLLLVIIAVLSLLEYFSYIYILYSIIGILIIIRIANREIAPSLKLPWAVIVLSIPIVGGLLYIMFGEHRLKKGFISNSETILSKLKEVQIQDSEIYKELRNDNKIIANQSRYLENYSLAPVFKNTSTKYLKVGEEFFEELKKDLLKAKKFIFMEFFIVQEGKMFDEVLDILIQKVNEGVEVRFMYDDLGCIRLLRPKYNLKLEALGIKCKVFNPFIPVLSIGHNNRDHRKIVVVDGNVGYTGGINLADEYINHIDRFGHWKDTGIRIEGSGVQTFTMMFLSMWNSIEDSNDDYHDYLSTRHVQKNKYDDGYVQPFGDSPLDDELVGEFAYINILNNAKDYVYIYTPYFVVDYTLLAAILNAAKRGVDIRIITPHIPDKWYVHIMTQSYYKQLIDANIRVFEYGPGFIHGKSFISDDEVGIIGTINLDYRSLVHHFECGVWMYKSKAILEMKKDFFETQEKSIEITSDMCKNVKWYVRWYREVFQFLAPLL